MPSSITHSSIGLVLYLLLAPYIAVHWIVYIIASNIMDISVLDKERGLLFRITHNLLVIFYVGLFYILYPYNIIGIIFLCLLLHWIVDFVTKGFLYWGTFTAHTPFKALNDYSKLKFRGYPLEPEIFSLISLLFVWLLV